MKWTPACLILGIVLGIDSVLGKAWDKENKPVNGFKFKRDASGACEEDDECDPNEECKDKECACKDGYIKQNNECLKTCTEDAECTGDHEECHNGMCMCKDGYTMEPSGECEEEIDETEAAELEGGDTNGERKRHVLTELEVKRSMLAERHLAERSSCYDSTYYCALYRYYYGDCWWDFSWMSTYCRRSCDMCQSSCSDIISSSTCASWAADGDCTNGYALWMSHYCRETCGKCPCDSCTDCQDNYWQCPHWAVQGYCYQYYYWWMKSNCRRSCRWCAGPCQNTDDDACNNHANNGNCAYYYIKVHCPVACGLCPT